MFTGLIALLCGAVASPLTTVPALDLSRYAGAWYEIARFDNRFERGCAGVTALYTLRDDGRVDVLNRCHKGGVDGPEREAHGLARLPDARFPGRLEVSFFRPFWGDYQVIALDPDYQWAVVGSPDRAFLWVLARDAMVREDTYAPGLQAASAQGFDLSRLQRTPQGR